MPVLADGAATSGTRPAPVRGPAGVYHETLRQRLRWGTAHLLRFSWMPRRGWLIAAILLTPALVMRLFTSVYPFLNTAWLSFTDASPMNDGTHVVGLRNYQNVLTGAVPRQAIVFTIVFALLSTLVELGLGMALALLLNAPFRLRALARAVALIPWAIPAIVTALGFRFMFADGFGIIPDLLHHVGVNFHWLTSPTGAKAAVIAANVWRSVPFIALVILAGLQGIPPEVHQAARMDGAGALRTLRSIVVPLVAPLLVTMGVFMLIFQIGTFDIILGMTGGGPGTATQVLSYLAYQDAFVGLDYGPASAMAMLLFALVAVVGLGALWLFRKVEVDL